MITYDEILERMRSKYTECTGIVPSEVSDISVRLRVLAGEIYSSAVNMEWLKNQMFASTATGKYLEYHAAERGLSRREASCAVGTVIFSLDEAAVTDVVIPKGTLVSTSGEKPLCFETTSQEVIYAGTYSAHAEIVAFDRGRKYNVPARKISVIVTPVTGALKVVNPDPCTSGTDTESDESLRARVIASYTYASNGTNCAYYEKIATETAGVASAAVVPRDRGAGTVGIYIAAQGTEASDETLQAVQEKINTLREVNVDALVHKAPPAVINLNLKIDVKDGYEFGAVKEACSDALREYIETRGVGGNVLLTEAGERVYHVEGVKEYSFDSYANSDTRCEKTFYPVTGTISITRGVLV